MLFKKKSDDRAEKQKNKGEIQNESSYEYEWLKSNYLLVDENVQIKDLKPYQKLVVIKTDEGSQKALIDYSLSEADQAFWQEQSLNGNLDIKQYNRQKEIKRYINTKLNTKVLLPYIDVKTNEVAKLANDLNSFQQNFAEFHEFDPTTTPPTFLDLSNKEGRVYWNDVKERFEKTNTFNELEEGVDDIDSVRIPIEELTKVRDNWKSVEQHLIQQEEIENEQLQSLLASTKKQLHTPVVEKEAEEKDLEELSTQTLDEEIAANQKYLDIDLNHKILNNLNQLESKIEREIALTRLKSQANTYEVANKPISFFKRPELNRDVRDDHDYQPSVVKTEKVIRNANKFYISDKNFSYQKINLRKKHPIRDLFKIVDSLYK